MKHLAAYLLLGLGGNTSPSAEDIKTVLSAVGIEADEERLTKLISELEGKDIAEVRPISHTRPFRSRQDVQCKGIAHCCNTDGIVSFRRACLGRGQNKKKNETTDNSVCV
ncbi:hypothetical protein E4U43_004099 [Claviceps pusilla]|uniref:60S acidic ribosomal protein P2 n=1 Tax=Claviceps pusilla TaxID=123648 RepID=A0A9P7NG48_9HYPO|nr:hypothetical protein E4U43_004099 [Claviceps pusilla]